MDDFDDLDLESASEAAAASRREVVLEDEPVAKILLPSISQKKPTTIKINLQKSGTGSRSVFCALKPEEPPLLDIPVPIPQQVSRPPPAAPPRPNLKEIDRPSELRRLYTQTYVDAESRRNQLFKREHNRGFRIVCRVCNLSCTSESNLIEHANGRRHLSALEELELKRTLPAEDREMKLAPGEPVPPGFEDQVKGVPKCQEMLDNFKDSPLIGLEYLVELLGDQENEMGRLVCFLCDRKGENPLQNIRQNVISHLIGTSHRTSYLKKFFPTAHEALQKTQNDRVRRTESGRLVRTVVANIEAEYGRLRPTTIEEYVFQIRKDTIRQQIDNDKHFRETPEKTFVEFVNPPAENLVTSFKADLQKAEERDREEKLKKEQEERRKVELRKREISPKRDSGFPKRTTEGANYRRGNKEDNGDSTDVQDLTHENVKKKARLDDPLKDTTPISLSSGSLSLSSSSRSRSRSPQQKKNRNHDSRDLRMELDMRKKRSRSPRNRRSRSRSPKRYIHNRSPKRNNRRRSRSPRRSPPGRALPRRSSPRRSPPRRSPVRRSPPRRSPRPRMMNSRSKSPSSRSPRPMGSQSPVHRSKSPSLPRSSSVLSQDSRAPWGSKSSRSRRPLTPPEQLHKRDKWAKYREEADRIEVKMEDTRQYHQKNPEKHPLYNDEWKVFWNRRYKELQAEGKDPSKYDFKPEWIPFWNNKMDELHMNEVKLRKDTLRKKLELSDEDDPVYKPRPRPPEGPPPNRPRDENRTRDDQEYEQGNFRDYNRPGPGAGSVSDMKDTWRALTGGEIHHEPPPARPRSPTWAPPNRFQRTAYHQEPEYYKRQQERSYKISAVLRLLTALEGQLGSFGPKVNGLLAQAISMEKVQAGSSEDLIRDHDNVVLFETIKEKLKGMLMAGVVDRGSVNASRLAITDLSAMLDHAPPPFTEDILSSVRKAESPRVTKATSAPATVTTAPVAVPGVGTIDRTAIAMQISAALLAQGKTDVSEAELQELIDAVIGMANKPSEEKPKEVVASTSENPQQNALTALQSAYEKSPPPPSTTPKIKIKDVVDLNDLSDSDLKSCLRIYQHLTSGEQRALITYLKTLEEVDPDRVENLRKYVNLGTGNIPEPEKKAPKKRKPPSPFSSRKGVSNPFLDTVNNDSDEDYSFDDVAKAATRNVEAKRKEDEKKKKEEELAKLKKLFKPADNNAIRQAIDKTSVIKPPVENKLTTQQSSAISNNAIKKVIDATTDSMMAGLRGFASRKEATPPAPVKTPEEQNKIIPIQTSQRFESKKTKQQKQQQQQIPVQQVPVQVQQIQVQQQVQQQVFQQPPTTDHFAYNAMQGQHPGYTAPPPQSYDNYYQYPQQFMAGQPQQFQQLQQPPPQMQQGYQPNQFNYLQPPPGNQQPGPGMW